MVLSEKSLELIKGHERIGNTVCGVYREHRFDSLIYFISSKDFSDSN